MQLKSSRFAFFEVRELVWEVLSEIIKKLSSDPDLIRDICVTLDKVTVFNVPYSVVCTYYFLEGGLHVLINGLIVMEEDDYCGQGCAKVLTEFVMNTLGLSKTCLRNILRNLAYDGR